MTESSDPFDIDWIRRHVGGEVLESALSMPPPAPQAPRPRPRADNAALALRRKQVVEAAKGSPLPGSVRRLAPQTASAFCEIAAAGLPVIIEGLVGNWPISSFEPHDLVSLFGHLRVSPRHGDVIADPTLHGMSLAEYLKLIEKMEPGPPPYVGDHPLPLPELCRWPDYFASWHTPGVWLGPPGTVTRLHCDYEDNLFAQVWGRKRFLLFSPVCADFLYVEEFSPLLFVSPFEPEQPDFERFPRSRSTKSIECVLRPGDLLYLPAGWFHHVRALDFSLSVNRWSACDPAVLAPSNCNQSREPGPHAKA